MNESVIEQQLYALANRVAALEIAVSRDRQQVATVHHLGEEDRYQEMERTVRACRDIVFDFMRTTGHTPTGPVWEDDYGSAGSVARATVPRETKDALRMMVHARLRELFKDGALAEDEIRHELHQAIKGQLAKAVHQALGISEYGAIDRTGALAVKVQSIVNADIDTLVAQQAPMMIAQVAQTQVPEGLVRWGQNAFLDGVRVAVRDLVARKVTEVANEAMSEAINDAILQAMPWLKKYAVSRRLGYAGPTSAEIEEAATAALAEEPP